MSSLLKLNDEWIKKGTSKVNKCLTDYLTGASDLQIAAIEELRKQYQNQEDPHIRKGLKIAIIKLKNLKP